MGKALKLKVRKVWGLILTFVEVTREKLVGAPFCTPNPLPPTILNRVNTDLYKSAFFTYSFKRVVLCQSVFCVFVYSVFCFEFVAIFIDFLYDICVIVACIGTTCSANLFSSRIFYIKLLVLIFVNYFCKHENRIRKNMPPKRF